MRTSALDIWGSGEDWRKEVTGARSEPLMAAGERFLSVSSLLLGTTLTHSLCVAMACSISGSGTSCVSLIVMACEWQRIEAIRTQQPSTGIGLAVPRILLVSR
jgi:hypothetical protein